MTSLFDLVNVDSPDWTTIELLLRSDEELMKRPVGPNGLCLLHYSCWKNAPSAFVIDLINNCPQAVQEKSTVGEYPLHIACQNNQSESVIQLLIEVFPEAARAKNNAGLYPLHIVCRNSLIESVAIHLLEVYPAAAQHKDNNNGCYPLHLACSNSNLNSNQSESIVVKLLEIFPEAIRHKTNNGEYPLHLACASNASLSIIKLLAVSYPDALHFAETVGNKTPLDCALSPKYGRNAISENIEFLKDATIHKEKLNVTRVKTGYNNEGESCDTTQPSSLMSYDSSKMEDTAVAKLK